MEVEYEPIVTVADRGTGVEGMKLWLHAEMGTNRNWHGVFEYGELEKRFKQAAHVVSHWAGLPFSSLLEHAAGK